jgi:hypothetical protein
MLMIMLKIMPTMSVMSLGCAGFAFKYFCFESKRIPFGLVFACSSENKGPIFLLRFALFLRKFELIFEKALGGGPGRMFLCKNKSRKSKQLTLQPPQQPQKEKNTMTPPRLMMAMLAIR